MKGRIDVYPYNQKAKSKKGNNLAAIEAYLSNFWGRSAVVESSARVGIYQALKFYEFKRFDHILVPDFTCQAILDILNTSSFPVKTVDSRTKAVLLLHQWGYPQKMEEVMAKAKEHNLLVIEDCAHGFDSTYRGQKIGTFGEVAVFSFSKLFPTHLGGVLVSANESLIKYVRQDQKSKDNFKNFIFNHIAFRIAKKSFELGKGQFFLDAVYLKSIHFPNIIKKALRLLPGTLQELQEALRRRKKNYLFLKEQIKEEYLPVDQDLEIEVSPFYVPVFLPESKLENTRANLAKQGAETEILHFDVNRNIFEANYRKCLAVPCHQYVSESHLNLICAAINES